LVCILHLTSLGGRAGTSIDRLTASGPCLIEWWNACVSNLEATIDCGLWMGLGQEEGQCLCGRKDLSSCCLLPSLLSGASRVKKDVGVGIASGRRHWLLV
jgi:hypothetical protein